MQATSELYKNLIADPGHVKECRLIVAGEEYDSDRIVSMETDGGLFERDTVCVGSAVSRQLDVVLYGAGEIPKGAKLIPEYRIRSGDQVSEWKRKGVYYIDTRDPRAAPGTLTIHAFDDLMRMEAEWIPSQDLEFPVPMDRAAVEIARYYGITIDSRSRLRSDYYIDYPTPGTSGRTLFKWIAAAHGGNWTMTDNGEARLVRLRDLDSETGSLVTEHGRAILIGGRPILVGKTAEKVYDGPSDKVFVGPNAADVSAPPALDPISKIVILVDDDNYFEAGDDSGLTLELTCPYGTQTMANDLLNELRGYRHVPLEAQDAIIDPAAEIGDGVTVNGVYTILASMATTFDALMPSDIGVPGERETESEIGSYSGPLIKSINRSIARTQSYITRTAEEIREEISSEVDGLSAFIDVQLGIIDEQVNGLDGRLGEIEVTAESVTQRVNGLDDAYAQIRTEVETITSNVSGLNGQFSLLEQTVVGFTFSGPDGKTMVRGSNVETGSLNLTGAITFSDLDDSTQGVINSKSRTFRSQPAGPYYVGDVWYKADGTVWRCKADEAQKGKFNASDWEQVTEDVGTVITKKLVDSPKIRGADICGAAYHDINELVNMELVPYEWEGDLSAGLTLTAKDGSQIFKITPNLLLHQDTGKLDYTGANLFLGDLRVLSGVLLDSEDIAQLITFGDEKTSIFFPGKKFFVPHPDDIDGDPISFDLTGSNIDLTDTALAGNVVSLGTSWTATTAEKFNLFLVVGRPGSGSSMVSVLIPKEALGNRYQLADNISYLAFTLNLGGVTINTNPSGGSIVGVYGIK